MCIGIWTPSLTIAILQELEGLEDPTKQEVAEIRKKIEVVDRELRPLKQICEKKVDAAQFPNKFTFQFQSF